MRGIRWGVPVFATIALGAAALQSVVGPARDVSASGEPTPLRIAADAVCEVEAIRPPVTAREQRSFEVREAHAVLSVEPPRYGTETDHIVLVPAHREGAEFETDLERLVLAEPSRRLTVVEAEFEPVAAFEPATVPVFSVEDGVLVEGKRPLDPMPEREVLREAASIAAVRLSAGIRMVQVKRLLQDGDGEPVPAETLTFERRTLEAPAKVTSKEVPAKMATAEVEFVVTPAERSRRAAVCDPAAHPGLLGRVAVELAAQGHAVDPATEEQAALLDAYAAWQAEEIGLLAQAFLLESLTILLPEVSLPGS